MTGFGGPRVFRRRSYLWGRCGGGGGATLCGSCTTQKALSHGVDLAKACANSTCFPPEQTTDAKISNWGPAAGSAPDEATEGW